jgi:hypothetical protein
MAIILAAPLMTVATFILRKGSVKAAKKYGPKLIKKAKDYIKKNKLILSGNKVIKPPKKSIKTVRKVNKKPTKKKDSFDEELKKKEGTKNFNKNNKNINKNTKNTTKNTTKNNKNTTKNTTKNKNKEDKPINQNIQTKPQLEKSLKNKKMITGAAIIGGGLALPFLKTGGGKKSGTEPSTFGAAFRKARKEKGPNSTFIYKGKVYSTVTEDQYKKAGFNSLREYLNAQKKK